MASSESPASVALTNLRVVAIDGGTGTGKSRLGDELAQLLRRKGVPALFISTGHLYRAVGWLALQSAMDSVKAKRLKSPEEILAEASAAVRSMDEASMVAMMDGHQLALHGGATWIDNELADVDSQLKGPGVGAVTPHGAGFLPIRGIVDVAVRRQVNEFDGFVIVEGRDIGHGVLPEAPLRLHLTVSPEVAAARSVEHTVAEIIARDESDHAHRYGRLKRPGEVDEATVVLPTDTFTPELVRDHVYNLMVQTFPALPSL